MKVESEGLFVGPDAGKALPNPIGGRMVVKVRDGDTGGSFSVHDNIIPAGSPGPLPHLHRNHEETFYVLEGELTVRVGERKVTAPVGSFVVIPRGVVHQPSNPATEPTRVLLIFSPSGMEHFFEEAAEERIPLQAVPTDPDVLERRGLRHEVRLRVRRTSPGVRALREAPCGFAESRGQQEGFDDLLYVSVDGEMSLVRIELQPASRYPLGQMLRMLHGHQDIGFTVVDPHVNSNDLVETKRPWPHRSAGRSSIQPAAPCRTASWERPKRSV